MERGWTSSSSSILAARVLRWLLAVIFVRLRRRTEALRNVEKLILLTVLVLDILDAPTALGRGVLDAVSELASGIRTSAAESNPPRMRHPVTQARRRGHGLQERRVRLRRTSRSR
ncbi:hypothetical protein SAM23877_7335 [Streptomyces ambofaciens ATCC 23877]|uniref:Uncharacterized protein n=1 Tax=Streptomyces ambofaciens (strain ATCC 23877 / 3486 / DSM 40053 / JCM 4204 / NBRC 12836 / NRRL B-2516) TaxID=278992 RepID=A0A0K2B5F4_STRA7|nr:hypothetical protein SAM23877_7335 [Streptomyces ambofaciens ATCC 23877]